MPVITAFEDLSVLAEKRVPRMFYDYADSGSWTESSYRAKPVAARWCSPLTCKSSASATKTLKTA